MSLLSLDVVREGFAARATTTVARDARCVQSWQSVDSERSRAISQVWSSAMTKLIEFLQKVLEWLKEVVR